MYVTNWQITTGDHPFVFRRIIAYTTFKWHYIKIIQMNHKFKTTYWQLNFLTHNKQTLYEYAKTLLLTICCSSIRARELKRPKNPVKKAGSVLVTTLKILFNTSLWCHSLMKTFLDDFNTTISNYNNSLKKLI